MEKLFRSSGILLPVTALPSPYGIGTMGYGAREFLQFLMQSGQQWWQILPAGHTGYGDSPYQAFSAFAGNPYWIDLEELAEEELLTDTELQSAKRENTGRIDYGWLAQTRIPLLRQAFSRIDATERVKLQTFIAEAGSWLHAYAVFMAGKEQNGLHDWTKWTNWAVPSMETRAFYSWLQYRFFRQWHTLRKIAGELGIRIMGDLPLYVAMDSADVVANPALFRLDAVAGVPPDAFSATGQRWGNPLYRWDVMAADGYRWWCDRIHMAARMYDAVRIDHFRGLSSFWSIPIDQMTAERGIWEPGPGIDFVRKLQTEVPQLQLIGEDLGTMTPELSQFLSGCRLPGLRVLQFASAKNTMHLPAYAPEQSVYYIGTHDNEVLREWLETADPALLTKIAGRRPETIDEAEKAMLRAALDSPAALCILRMQDVLGLGRESRINTPGTASGNWMWRLRTIPSQQTAACLRDWTRTGNRGRN